MTVQQTITGSHSMERRGRIVYERVLFALFLLLAFEITVGSSGHWLLIGSTTPRILLLGIFALASLPLLLFHWKVLIRQPFMYQLAAFILWMLYTAAQGIRRDYNDAFVRADLRPYLMLLILPAAVLLLSRGNRLETVCRTVSIGALLLALFAVSMHIAEGAGLAMDWLCAIVVAQSHGIIESAAWFTRLFFRSEIFLIFGFCYAWVVGASCGHRARRILYACVSGVCAMALLISLTRALWLGLAGAVMVILLSLRRDFRALLRQAVLIAFVLAILISVSTIVYERPVVPEIVRYRLDPKLVVVLPSKDVDGVPMAKHRSVGVDIRKESLAFHRNQIRENRVWRWAGTQRRRFAFRRSDGVLLLGLPHEDRHGRPCSLRARFFNANRLAACSLLVRPTVDRCGCCECRRFVGVIL